MPSTPAVRRVAALAAGALALAGVAALSSPAAADPSPPGTAAASWITGRLVDGRLFPESYNNGFNIDAGFAELAMGNRAAVDQIRDALAASINGYIAGDDFGDVGSTYANATAKSLSFVVQSGGNPRSFGGVDLVSRLEGTVSAAPTTAGRIADTSSYGDFANTIGQAYATEGLAAVASPRAGAVRAFLLRQQCPDGRFRLSFSAPDAAEQGCVANPSGESGPDVTAYVVQALQAQHDDPAVRSALDRAVTWLRSIQGADGSFTDGDGKANSNSTGLAAVALGESCALDAARRAAAWVRSVQVPAGQTGALAGEVGAIAFGPTELAAAQSAGIADQQQWKVSTAQATPGLSYDAAAAPTVQVTGPGTYVRGGRRAAVTITGVAVGERVCVSDSHGGKAALTGTGAPLSYRLGTAERGSEDITVTATTGPGLASAVVEVLGTKRLRLRLDRTVAPGDRVKVKVKGLAAGERVKVLLDGKRLARGKATRRGVFTTRLPALHRTGRHTLRVTGQFRGRVGTTTLRVAR